MSDYAVAAMILVFLVALAVAAPIWGVDSRDGIESDQAARRVAWLHGSPAGMALGHGHSGIGGRSAGVLLAGVLRSAARRLDNEAVGRSELDAQASPA
jgi:hypothetical protein